MVDGRFCTVGSANLNARSLRWDYEENAVIIDPHTTKELCDLFDREKADSFKKSGNNGVRPQNDSEDGLPICWLRSCSTKLFSISFYILLIST